MNLPEIDVKYIFLDVVKFTREDRALEDQVYIIGQLNRIVQGCIKKLRIPVKKRILLPTGDGMCIALLNLNAYDIHLRFALELLKEISRLSAKQKKPVRRFQVRIGINDNVDTRVTDINGARNILGKGINDTQRVMSIADGDQILVSHRVFETLMQHDKYKHAFKRRTAIVKHDIPTDIHQFIDKTYYVALTLTVRKASDQVRFVKQQIGADYRIFMTVAMTKLRPTYLLRSVKRVTEFGYSE